MSDTTLGHGPGTSPFDWRRLVTMGAVLVLSALLTAVPLAAQRADSARVGAAPRRDTTAATARPAAGPPISPRRAFLYSLLLPGFGQARLDRPNAGALFVAVEAMSLAMARKSAADLREAKRLRAPGDSVIVGFAVDPATGMPRLDTEGNPIPVRAPSRWTGARVRARRTHYEDWVAAILFNHLFSGADAFVAAQLWDLPTQISIRAEQGGATVAARIAW